MPPAGHEVLARWREVGEWWSMEPGREVERYIDAHGIRREEERPLPSLGNLVAPLKEPPQEDHREEWSLRPRKIRDEKVTAACGGFGPAYYEEQARERDRKPFEVMVPNHGAGVCLHAISGYAFGRGTMLPEEIAARAAEAGIGAVGIADPHSLIGCMEFAKACQKQGIRPLIGASFELPEGGEIVLIARSKRGYVSLSQLITECQMHEPRGFPMARWERMEKHADGLLCLTGGDLGPVNRALMRRDHAEAERIMRRLIDLYGQVFLEIERSYLPWQMTTNKLLFELGEHLGVPVVAGGIATHAHRQDFTVQDILVCSETLCLVDEIVGRKPQRAPGQPTVRELPRRGLNAERFVLDNHEWRERFADCPEVIENAWRVVEACDDDVLPGRTQLPCLFPDPNHALHEIVYSGAHGLYPKITPAIRKRLDFELGRIQRLNFSNHFLTAWDTCRWAREQHIQLSGRGSVVDSVVAYCLGFSRVDAIRHKLHFDRFLPEDGSKRPDIDIDFEAFRRDDVRNYMVKKYGVDRVATVAAVGAFCSRGIIREVGKALGLAPEVISFLTKRLHRGVAPDQLEAALDRRPELRGSHIPRERFRWVFQLAERMTDIPRNMRAHSSGVVISDRPISETVPVMWSASAASREEDQGLRIIQWDKRSAKYAFDKFDILCLRGQDVLGGTDARIRRREPDFSVERVPVDDPETYRAMRSGELIGIPQSASPAMRQAHIRMRTDNLDDASLVQAGIRPGVGGAVKINTLIRRRRGLEKYSFAHPELERILAHTYGIVVFQEQIDQLLQAFCSYSSGQAEDIRDAIHKRRREDYGRAIREELLDRMQQNGHPIAVAEEVFELIAGFKGYGFAQGHALAFAEISIRSIWCQQNYPADYFAALLSAQPAGYYGPCTLVNEARARGVTILPPDVTRSQAEFSVEDSLSTDPELKIPGGAIRVPLSQIRGVSKETIARILSFSQPLREGPDSTDAGHTGWGNPTHRPTPVEPQQSIATAEN
ncbi:MAG: DNA polymerase III subunit alpha [Fimbriimonas sp.]